MAHPIRLSELTPGNAAIALARTPRLLVPVGTLTARGPHLPLGCDTMLLERLTDDLSMRTGIPRTPVIAFGVSSAASESRPGCAGLTRKTLHRTMNELIAAWETGAKVTDVVILTAHATEGHQEALSTIRSTAAVRLIDVFGLEYGDLLTDRAGPVHGGELDTSLLLHLFPDLVRRDAIPADVPASAETGQLVYQRLLHRIAIEVG